MAGNGGLNWAGSSAESWNAERSFGAFSAASAATPRNAPGVQANVGPAQAKV